MNNDQVKPRLEFVDTTPPHKCKHNLVILVQEHSVNSLHNIVIYQKSKCKICGKIFEESDPRGIKCQPKDWWAFGSKVYEASHPIYLSLAGKRDYKKVPQIKIKNDDLRKHSFNIGKEYAVIYQPGKITLVLIEREVYNN